MNAKFYVVTTDTFMSGWGKAEGKTNKLILPCESYEQAEIVEKNAKARQDQTNVSIRKTMPKFDEGKVFAQVKTIKDYPSWYEEGRFQK